MILGLAFICVPNRDFLGEHRVRRGDGEVGKQAGDEGDAEAGEVRCGAGAGGGQAGDDGLVGHAARGVSLRVEEELEVGGRDEDGEAYGEVVQEVVEGGEAREAGA